MYGLFVYGIVVVKFVDIIVLLIGYGYDVYVNSVDLKFKFVFCDFLIVVCEEMVM